MVLLQTHVIRDPTVRELSKGTAMTSVSNVRKLIELLREQFTPKTERIVSGKNSHACRREPGNREMAGCAVC